jgi:hypothetical protein
MLDENLPTFYIKPSSGDNPLSSTIYLSQNGSELQPEYTLRRPDPSLAASKNCYAVALYDSYNPEVLFAEVLVRPEWTQPTLSAAEIRAQNGIPPPPVPIVPNTFTVQLYNPDQQVVIRQIAGSWNSSAHWEFEMPQNSFRVPSASALDRSQDDPAASDITPKIAFKWKRDGKLSKDISCYLSGRTTDTKKNKEPDIPVAMFKGGKNLTMYAPNMHRVEVEDVKGLEVVLLLSATVTKDIFFNANREMFNIGNPTITTTPGMTTKRKNSGPVINGGKTTTTSPVHMSGAVLNEPPRRTNPVPASQILPNQPPRQQQQQAVSRPPPPDPQTKWEIDAETERLKKIVEAEERAREKADHEEAKRIQKMIEKEDRDRRKREAEVEKETERLRKQYGVPPPPVQVSPPLPGRPGLGQPPPQSFPQYQSAPHSRPVPVVRPMSTPTGPQRPYGHSGSVPSTNSYLTSNYRPPPQNPSPYLQAPGQGTASSSGFFGLGGKKVQKKRSVFF